MTRSKTLSRALALALVATTAAFWGGSRAAAAVDACMWKDGPFHMEGALEFPETTLGGLGQVWKPDEPDAAAEESRPHRAERHRRRHRDGQSEWKERLEHGHARHRRERPAGD